MGDPAGVDGPGREPRPDVAAPPSDDAGEGGDAVCWLPLVCPECGELDGHRPGCRVAAELPVDPARPDGVRRD